MQKPDHSPEEVPEETKGVPEDQSPISEELMMLVLSGPMLFDCLDEVEATEEVE